MKSKLLQSTDPNAPDFDYEKWKKENKIEPALSINISIPKPEDEEEEAENDEIEMEDEPEEYKKFLEENKVKPAKETIDEAMSGLFGKFGKKQKRSI
jgi:hypothetical protein